MSRLGLMLAPVLVLGLTLGLAIPASAADRKGHLIVAQNSAPEICTEVYQPVCGSDPSGVRKTYSNACFARVAKATNVTPGECPK
jgi:Kazal-type serine protease inhibitor domain